jgi:hypothetical protein
MLFLYVNQLVIWFGYVFDRFSQHGLVAHIM